MQLTMTTMAIIIATIAVTLVPARAQGVQYGVRIEAGENWAYIETTAGQELIAAPYVVTDGFKDVGGALAGSGSQPPQLSGVGTLAPSSLNSLHLTSSLPGAATVCIVGVSQLDAPFKGGTLVPSPTYILSGPYTDASGSWSVPFIWPAAYPTGFQFFIQCWIPDVGAPHGFSATNGLQCNAQLAGQVVEDESRIRLLGLTPDEVAALDGLPNVEQVAILNGPDALEASSLWTQGFPAFSGGQSEAALLSRLSQSMAFIVHKAAPYTGLNSLTANDCTDVPAFNFVDCCNAHDECYYSGDCGVDRYECDVSLRDCIAAHDHPLLAWIYYWGVRAFGASHFNQPLPEMLSGHLAGTTTFTGDPSAHYYSADITVSPCDGWHVEVSGGAAHVDLPLQLSVFDGTASQALWWDTPGSTLLVIYVGTLVQAGRVLSVEYPMWEFYYWPTKSVVNGSLVIDYTLDYVDGAWHQVQVGKLE